MIAKIRTPIGRISLTVVAATLAAMGFYLQHLQDRNDFNFRIELILITTSTATLLYPFLVERNARALLLRKMILAFISAFAGCLLAVATASILSGPGDVMDLTPVLPLAPAYTLLIYTRVFRPGLSA